MLVLIGLVVTIGGVIWMFISEDLRTRRRLKFLEELEGPNNENS